MDLKKVLFPLHKWWWLLLLSTILAAGGSLLAVQGQPDRYEARTTLMVGSTMNDPNPTGNDFIAGESLAVAYAEIANREGVRNATMEALGFQNLPQYVAQALPRTQFLEIIVTDLVAERAQMVANELATQLIQLSPTNLSTENAGQLDVVNTQLGLYEQDIISTQAEIDAVKASLGTLTSAQEIENAQAQLNALQSKLNTLNTTYTSLLASTGVDGINRLTIIEPAALPSRPVGLSTIVTVALAAGIGLVLALGAVYLLEYFLDNSIKFPDEIERVFNSKTLGHIFSTSGIKRNRIPISKYTTHPTAEAFRSLKTNLLFMGRDRDLKTIFAASPDKSTKQSKFVVNLALSLAEGGKKVVLVDADLRVPSLHQYFKLSSGKGLGEVLTHRAGLDEVIQPVNEGYFSLIVAGSKHYDGVEWLDSTRMDAVLEQLKSRFDIVLVDGPPYIVADASILGSKVDGVLAVVRPGVTKREAAVNMAEQVNRSHATLLGVTLIEIPSWGSTYFAKIPNNRYYTA